MIAVHTPFLTVLAAGTLEGILLGSIFGGRTLTRFWSAVVFAFVGVWTVLVFEGTLLFVRGIDAMKQVAR